MGLRSTDCFSSFWLVVENRRAARQHDPAVAFGRGDGPRRLALPQRGAQRAQLAGATIVVVMLAA